MWYFAGPHRLSLDGNSLNCQINALPRPHGLTHYYHLWFAGFVLQQTLFSWPPKLP